MMEQLEKDEAEGKLEGQTKKKEPKQPAKEEETEEAATVPDELSAPAKKKIDFDNTEDALDQVGASLAKRAFEKNLKKGQKTKKKMQTKIEI